MVTALLEYFDHFSKRNQESQRNEYFVVTLSLSSIFCWSFPFLSTYSNLLLPGQPKFSHVACSLLKFGLDKNVRRVVRWLVSSASNSCYLVGK